MTTTRKCLCHLRTKTEVEQKDRLVSHMFTAPVYDNNKGVNKHIFIASCGQDDSTCSMICMQVSCSFVRPNRPVLDSTCLTLTNTRHSSDQNILSQTYNATLFLFDCFYVNAHALSKLFHSVNRSFNQASNHVLVLAICLKLAKKQ